VCRVASRFHSRRDRVRRFVRLPGYRGLVGLPGRCAECFFCDEVEAGDRLAPFRIAPSRDGDVLSSVTGPTVCRLCRRKSVATAVASPTLPIDHRDAERAVSLHWPSDIMFSSSLQRAEQRHPSAVLRLQTLGAGDQHSARPFHWHVDIRNRSRTPGVGCATRKLTEVSSLLRRKGGQGSCGGLCQ
jgi:hypothetical protein